MQMQHSPQQFVQTLGQIPQQQPQFGQGTNNAQQMQQFLLQQQLQQTMQNAKPHLQQPPPMQMQGFNQGMPQQNQAAKMMMPGTQAQLTNLLLGQQSLANANSTPIDILGLADKAAQALSGGLVQGAQQMNGHRSNNPNFPPPPAPAPAQSFHQQQPMASEKDLPMMVQYAIQVIACLETRMFNLYNIFYCAHLIHIYASLLYFNRIFAQQAILSGPWILHCVQCSRDFQSTLRFKLWKSFPLVIYQRCVTKEPTFLAS